QKRRDPPTKADADDAAKAYRDRLLGDPEGTPAPMGLQEQVQALSFVDFEFSQPREQGLRRRVNQSFGLDGLLVL
ncbi:hypothetical protein EBR25_11840, partial [bacterium]|nr:hypothetical protein [bacterium]